MKSIWSFFADGATTGQAIKRALLLLATTVILILLMTPVLWDTYWSILEPKNFTAGQVANSSIQAPRDYLIEDTISTERLQARSASRVKQVFRLNDNAENLTVAKLAKVYSKLAEFASVESLEESSKTLDLTEDKKQLFAQQFRIKLESDEWSYLLRKDKREQIKATLSEILDPLFDRGVIANKQVLDNALIRSGAQLFKVSSNEEIEIYTSSAVLDYAEANALFQSSLSRNEFRLSDNINELMKKLGLVLLEPNISLDMNETEKRRADARSKVEPVYYKFHRGEFIIRANDVISASQERLLEEIRQQHKSSDVFRSVVGYLVLTVLIIITVFLFTINIWPGFKPSLMDLGVVSIVLITSMLSLKVFRIFGDALSFSYPELLSEAFLMAAPVAAGGILLEVTLGASSVFLFTMTFALLTGVYMENTSLLLLLIIMGNIAGAVSVKECPRRSVFISAGIRVALINLVIVLSFILLQSQASGSEHTLKIICAIVSGLLSGLVAASLTPVAEFFGSYITDMKLLELASLDRPLLRELSVQAPGTWNHSMVMGQMGEAAAEAIGANSLLTRVGAYYHDIGKMKNPTYFIENQGGRENKHEKLAPSMSALIIKAHVKNGVEMANQHRVPRQLIDFIREHHGTALIEYFYDKAIKESEADEVVDDANYRYGGPKPQTKESGILMMADSVEAASRTLSDPTPAKIQGLVQKMINKIFASGELDESELTLKELHLIAKEFTRVLQGIHHRRVEYSEPADKTRHGETRYGDTRHGETRHGDTRSGDNRGAGETTETKSDTKQKLAVVKPQKKGEESDRDSGETGSGEASGDGEDDKKSSKGSKDTLKRLGI